jgi:hypothetical protein
VWVGWRGSSEQPTQTTSNQPHSIEPNTSGMWDRCAEQRAQIHTWLHILLSCMYCQGIWVRKASHWAAYEFTNMIAHENSHVLKNKTTTRSEPRWTDQQLIYVSGWTAGKEQFSQSKAKRCKWWQSITTLSWLTSCKAILYTVYSAA